MRHTRPHRTAARRLVAAGLLASGVSTATWAQQPAPAAAFEVASVKRFEPSAERRASDAISVMPGGRFTAPSATLRGLIAAAYGILDIQIMDAQRVLSDARFEIEARANPEVSIADARAMLQRLLVERFRLAAHQETRELPVYILTIAREDRRLGEQLRPAGPDCAVVKGPPGLPAPPPPPPSENVGRVLSLTSGPLRCGSLVFSSTSGGHWSIREMTMARFAERLVAALGRPVIDRTGLEGAYDLDLTYTPDTQVVDASNAPNAPALVTAIREQLGLRLESTRAPVDVLVIDGVAQPTEN